MWGGGWREMVASQGRRGATGALRPCAGILEGLWQPPLPSPVATNCWVNTPLGFTLSFPGGEMDRLATPQYHRERQGPRQAPVVCFPVSAVRPSGRLVGRAGCGHLLGLWFQLSQELAVWSSSPLSCLCRRDVTAPPISQSNCYQVCEITSVKVAYKL